MIVDVPMSPEVIRMLREHYGVQDFNDPKELGRAVVQVLTECKKEPAAEAALAQEAERLLAIEREKWESNEVERMTSEPLEVELDALRWKWRTEWTPAHEMERQAREVNEQLVKDACKKLAPRRAQWEAETRKRIVQELHQQKEERS